MKMFHVSSVLFAEKISGQSMFLKWDLSPEMLALLQFGLVGLSVFFAILIFSTIFKMQWSLLPILPSSVIEMNLSWQFVIIRSSMLPFIWVGKSTSWARPSSSVVSRTFLPRDVELSSSQLMSGKLTSPMTMEFLSRFFNRSQRLSMFWLPDVGGL